MNLPKGRKPLYAIYHACERFNILPPGAEKSWDDCTLAAKSELLSYNMIRCLEEHEDGS